MEKMIDYINFVIFSLYYNDPGACRSCGGISWEGGDDQNILLQEKELVAGPSEKNPTKYQASVSGNWLINRHTKRHIQIRFGFNSSTPPYLHIDGIAVIKMKDPIVRPSDELQEYFQDQIGEKLMEMMENIVGVRYAVGGLEKDASGSDTK